MQTEQREERPHLSVVIPVFNETQRLENPLRSIANHLAQLGYPSEIVVVDDGSIDGTFERIQSLEQQLRVPVRAIRYEKNRGKGHALRVGFAHARGDRVLFTDIDLATPIEELGALDAAMDAGCDVVIGSRLVPGAKIHVHQPWVRERMGRIFTWLVRSFLADVSDATCGFKMFRGDVGRELFSLLRIDGWSFDAELLFLAQRRGLRITEVPVRWQDMAGTKVRLLRDAWSSLLGLITIASNQRLGLYHRPSQTDLDVAIWCNGFQRPVADSEPTEASRS